MEKIRSFLYLDNYKMYSISSQLFEGLTEYVLTSNGNEDKVTETQKGPIGSGKVLADILQKSSTQTEKKFLHDYSYNLFEAALIEKGKVLEVDKYNIKSSFDDLKEYSFVKVTGRVIFNDLDIIENTLGRFNEIGESIGYVIKKAEYDKEIADVNIAIEKIPDRNQKAKMKSFMKSKSDFKKLLKEEGLQLDEDYISHLCSILNYGYNQQFEVQIPLNDACMFSAQLDRDCLKDKEHCIIKKYSRETEKEFVLFGVLTQVEKESERESLLKDRTLDWEDEEADGNLKESIMNIVTSIIGLEKTFSGKLDYEVIVDPIAMYIEL